MNSNAFLAQVGWPEAHMSDAGQAKWSGAASGEMSSIQATLDRDGEVVLGKVRHVSMDGAESLLEFEARMSSGDAEVVRAEAGAPPEVIPAEEAVELFNQLRSGLGRFKFTNMGPAVLSATTSLS